MLVLDRRWGVHHGNSCSSQCCERDAKGASQRPVVVRHLCAHGTGLRCETPRVAHAQRPCLISHALSYMLIRSATCSQSKCVNSDAVMGTVTIIQGDALSLQGANALTRLRTASATLLR